MGKQDVPTRNNKSFISRFLNPELKYISTKLKATHNPYYSNVLCKFFIKNMCDKENNCIFSHDISNFDCPLSSEGKICSTLCGYKHPEIENVGKRSEKIFHSPFI